MAATTERIANRNPTSHGGPPWLGFLVTAVVPTYLFVILLASALGTPNLLLFVIVWNAYVVLYPLAVWSRCVQWMEVGPDRIAVRRPFRVRSAALADVVRVDVHRNDWVPGLGRWRRAYTVYVWRTSARPWRLDYVEPEAKDRLLAALHGRGTPILVFAAG